VFPFQYLFANTTGYALRFDILYLVENLALIGAIGIASLRMRRPWRTIYLHLLGASALYALSSAVANAAIDSGGYVYGHLYGLGLTASACWFVWIPVHARVLDRGETKPAGFYAVQSTPLSSKASAWAMILIATISIPAVWELFQREEAAGLRTFRLLAANGAILFLAAIAYIDEYLARRELVSQLDFANQRLQLAVEAGKSIAYEWDLKAMRFSWFGDLQTLLGLPSETFAGGTRDVDRYVHPDDKQSLTKVVADAKASGEPGDTEFRILRSDGAVRWVRAAGKFHYASSGDAVSMLGIAIDITERKLMDAALAGVGGWLIEAQDQERSRIARELHDDIGQRLALVSIGLAQLQQGNHGGFETQTN
jgi:PAS domain S-box-containing protein